MRLILTLLIASTTLPAVDAAHDFTIAPMTYPGKTVLYVNIASQCGYSPQYKGLEALYRRFQAKGFIVVGIPTDDIQPVCKRDFAITFPINSKSSTANLTSSDFQWNFTKILVDRNGKVIRRFEPNVDPESRELVESVERALIE